MEISSYKLSAPMTIEKIKILGAVWSYQLNSDANFCQFSLFILKMGQMGCIGSAVQLVHSSKTAPRILILSIAMCADYSF